MSEPEVQPPKRSQHGQKAISAAIVALAGAVLFVGAGLPGMGVLGFVAVPMLLFGMTAWVFEISRRD